MESNDEGPLWGLHAVTLEGFTRSNDTLIDFYKWKPRKNHDYIY